MNTNRKPVAVAVTAFAICIGGTVFGPQAQAARIDTAGVSTHQFDDIGYIVAYRKAQMAHDYVANAPYRAGQVAGPGA